MGPTSALEESVRHSLFKDCPMIIERLKPGLVEEDLEDFFLIA